jgi:hypothetical protein
MHGGFLMSDMEKQVVDGWETQSQNLFEAIEALKEKGFAILKAKSGPCGKLNIQCACLKKPNITWLPLSGSPNNPSKGQ